MMSKRRELKDELVVKAEGAKVLGYSPPSREGKIIVNVATYPAVRSQIKSIAAEQGTSSQSLILEAFNMMFEKYGKKPIA